MDRSLAAYASATDSITRSAKIHVDGCRSGGAVPLSSGEDLDLYDTSGPYADPGAAIDVTAAFPSRPGVVFGWQPVAADASRPSHRAEGNYWTLRASADRLSARDDVAPVAEGHHGNHNDLERTEGHR